MTQIGHPRRMSLTAKQQAAAFLAEMLLEQPSRVLQDALTSATAAYWRNRAVRFDNARPKPGDYFGARLGRLDHVPDDSQVQALDRRLAAQAEACRMRAYVCDVDELSENVRAEILRLLGSEAAA